MAPAHAVHDVLDVALAADDEWLQRSHAAAVQERCVRAGLVPVERQLPRARESARSLHRDPLGHVRPPRGRDPGEAAAVPALLANARRRAARDLLRDPRLSLVAATATSWKLSVWIALRASAKPARPRSPR